MLDFKGLKLNKKDPVYIQISNYVKRLIYLGYGKSGDTLPSRRELASVLEINPNTAQKAFKFMEDEGIIQANTNSVSILSFTEEKLKSIQEEFTKDFIIEFIDEAKQNNIDYKQAIELLTKYW